MVQFLSINFFSWISSIFVGFFNSSRFFVSFCIIVKFQRGCTPCYAVKMVFIFIKIKHMKKNISYSEKEYQNIIISEFKSLFHCGLP